MASSKSNRSNRNSSSTRNTGSARSTSRSAASAKPISPPAKAVPVAVARPTLMDWFRGVSWGRVAINLVLLVVLVFLGVFAFSQAQEAYYVRSGVAATVNGTPIYFSELAKGKVELKEVDPATVTAEDILNLARRKTFEKYLDENNAPLPTEKEFEASLESYIGTKTIDVAASEYNTTPKKLKGDLMFDLRMKTYRKAYTGFTEDAPKMPADAATNQKAMAEYQSAMTAYQERSSGSDEKWNKLLSEMFLNAKLRLFTLNVQSS